MNKYLNDALKVKDNIEKLLNFKSKSEIYVDNDLDRSHCKDNSCPYIKENSKQPCTCYNHDYIRLVGLNNNHQTDYYRLYYQLSHELGHQWLGMSADKSANVIDKYLDEVKACYTTLVVFKYLSNEPSFENCLCRQLNNKQSDYYNYYQVAQSFAQELNYTLDKNIILDKIETIRADLVK